MLNIKKFSQRQRGQGMTEYIIIVALIAVAAIGVYNEFGKTVRDQTSAMAEGLAGKETEATTASTSAGTEAANADTFATRNRGLKDFGKDSADH